MTYADPSFEGMSGLLTYINTISEGVFGFMIPPFIFIVAFMGFEAQKNYFGSSRDNFVGASFLTAMTCMILLSLGLISETVFTAWVVLFLISMISVWMK